MTPEERAAASVRAMQDQFSGMSNYRPCLRDCLGDGFDDVVRFIAAAIREAVAEEREACAALADSEWDGWGQKGDKAEVAASIAALIRARP